MIARPDCDHAGCIKQSTFFLFYYLVQPFKNSVSVSYADKGLFACREHAKRLHKGMAQTGAIMIKRGEKGLKLTVVDLEKPVRGIDWSKAPDKESFYEQLRVSLQKAVGPIRGV